MASGRMPGRDEVLRLLRDEAADGRFAFAPGRLSFEGLYARLAIGGAGRGPATRAALGRVLARLVDEGRVRVVEVVGPDGAPSAGWYEVADNPLRLAE